MKAFHAGTGFLISFLIFFSCSPRGSNENTEPTNEDSASVIVDLAIEVYGGKNYEAFSTGFRLRNKEYAIKKDRGNYWYTLTWSDSLKIVRDELSNDAFSRKINGRNVDLPDWEKDIATENLKSEIYFALLPYGLQDPSTVKNYLGIHDIGDKGYYLIGVGFEKNGGLKHHDEFLFWFDLDDLSMDYFAYRFHSYGGGTRFRKTIGATKVNDIIFQNYENYQGPDSLTDLSDFPKLYTTGKLQKLPDITLENFQEIKLAVK